jgi:hypothetical protein
MNKLVELIKEICKEEEVNFEKFENKLEIKKTKFSLE